MVEPTKNEGASLAMRPGSIHGNPSEEEFAAIAAVFDALADELAAQDTPRDLPTEQSRWVKSQRAMRGVNQDPFAPDPFGSRYA